MDWVTSVTLWQDSHSNSYIGMGYSLSFVQQAMYLRFGVYMLIRGHTIMKTWSAVNAGNHFSINNTSSCRKFIRCDILK